MSKRPSDKEETRPTQDGGPYGKPEPTPLYVEHWRGTCNGVTYRLVIHTAHSFNPERVVLERRISQGSEPETWTAEVMPQ